MLRFTKLVHHPRKLYRMTGLAQEQFQMLTDCLTPLWTQAEHTRLPHRPRQHEIGQGRKYKLATMADKLLCLLVFYWFYLTDELLGWLMGLDASTVCRLQAKLEPLLEQAADPTPQGPPPMPTAARREENRHVGEVAGDLPRVRRGRHRCH